MEAIDHEWISNWAHERQIDVSVDGILALSYQHGSSKRAIVLTDTERAPADLILLANRLVWVNSDEESDFQPGPDKEYIFWIRERDIWDDMSEALASEAFACVLRAHQQPLASKGVLFYRDELHVCVLFTLYSILFGWDSYLIPCSGSFLCHISHDGYIDLRASQEPLLERLFKRVEPWGAEVRPI
jgi:hypothetical protein